jgi:hypothetical protein
MNIFLMEMDAKNRMKDFQREANMRGLVKQLKAQRRAPAITPSFSLGAILRRLIVGGRLLKPQA